MLRCIHLSIGLNFLIVIFAIQNVLLYSLKRKKETNKLHFHVLGIPRFCVYKLRKKRRVLVVLHNSSDKTVIKFNHVVFCVTQVCQHVAL